MPNPYGRPRTNNLVLKVRLPEELIPRLFLAHPELFKPNEPGVFRHGALSSYIARLVKQDLDSGLGAELQLEGVRSVF